MPHAMLLLCGIQEKREAGCEKQPTEPAPSSRSRRKKPSRQLSEWSPEPAAAQQQACKLRAAEHYAAEPQQGERKTID